jgi:hypothetical protein
MPLDRNVPAPPPLPSNRTELQALRTVSFDVNINDLVDNINTELFLNDPEYKEYLRAVHDSQAKEGALSADNWSAARMVREYARENAIGGVMNENLATIGKALNVALRRAGLSRKQRRNMVHGEVVPSENGDE